MDNSTTTQPYVVIVMGVSGCGKTTVAQALAKQLGARCLDADDFHPQENVDKMRAGQPLTDTDRWPWLDKLNGILRHSAAKNESMVLACSALRESYRERLGQRIQRAKFVIVHLHGSFELIESRIRSREHQYMPSTLLQSQFATLESPTNAIDVAIELPLEQQVELIIQQLPTH
jgi:gluconokinase